MTLLELMVAIAVFSLVAASAYAALRQGLVIQDGLQEQRRFWQRFETVFNLVHSDLEQTVDVAPQTTISRGRAFIGHERGSADGDGQLREFTRATHTAFSAGPASPFLRVAYRFHDGSLYRRTWSRLALPYGTEAAEALLLDGIEDVRFRYLPAADGWAPRWPQIPDPEDSTGLPRAVEMTVGTNDHGSYRWLFHVGPPR